MRPGTPTTQMKSPNRRQSLGHFLMGRLALKPNLEAHVLAHVPLVRGAVYRTLVDVTRQGGGGAEWIEKYIVVLQDPGSMDPGAANYAFVIASTDRTGRRGPRAFEARLGPDGGFSQSTIVDGRWVYTNRRADLNEEDYQFTLSAERMDD